MNSDFEQGPLSGRQLGPWQLGSRLGQGGMGAVYRAESAKGPVAVKVLTGAVEPELLMRFQREAEAAASVSRHPGVLRILSADLASAPPWIAFELAGGGALSDLCGAPMALEELGRIARGLAEGLAHLHSEGIVHRDLKPSNVLFREDSRAPLIADFGLARIEGGERLTRTGAMLGTPEFMAPEQIAGETVTPATDCWAFGAILYLLATGRRPFAAETLPGLYQEILRRDPPPVETLRPDLPPELVALTDACLAKSADQRPGSGAELLAGLDQTLAPRRRGGVSRRALAALVMSAALIGLGLLAWRVSALKAQHGRVTVAIQTHLQTLKDVERRARRDVATAMVSRHDPTEALEALLAETGALAKTLGSYREEDDRERTLDRLRGSRPTLISLVELASRRAGVASPLPAPEAGTIHESLPAALADPEARCPAAARASLTAVLGSDGASAILGVREALQARRSPAAFAGLRKCEGLLRPEAFERLSLQVGVDWTLDHWQQRAPAPSEEATRCLLREDFPTLSSEFAERFRRRNPKSRSAIVEALPKRPALDSVATRVYASPMQRPASFAALIHRARAAAAVPKTLAGPEQLFEFGEALEQELRAAFLDPSHVPTQTWPSPFIGQRISTRVWQLDRLPELGSKRGPALVELAILQLGAMRLDIGLPAIGIDLATQLRAVVRPFWESLTAEEQDAITAWCGLEEGPVEVDERGAKAARRLLERLLAAGDRPRLLEVAAGQWLRLTARVAKKSGAPAPDEPESFRIQMVAVARRDLGWRDVRRYPIPNELPDQVVVRFFAALTPAERLELSVLARRGAELRRDVTPEWRAAVSPNEPRAATPAGDHRDWLIRGYDSLDDLRNDLGRYSAREALCRREAGQLPRAEMLIAQATRLAPLHDEVLKARLEFCPTAKDREALLKEVADALDAMEPGSQKSIFRGLKGELERLHHEKGAR